MMNPISDGVTRSAIANRMRERAAVASPDRAQELRETLDVVERSPGQTCAEITLDNSQRAHGIATVVNDASKLVGVATMVAAPVLGLLCIPAALGVAVAGVATAGLLILRGASVESRAERNNRTIQDTAQDLVPGSRPLIYPEGTMRNPGRLAQF